MLARNVVLRTLGTGAAVALLVGGAWADGDRTWTGWLGVSIAEETEYHEGGARITRVIEGSPAEEAGLRAGDIIVDFDGRTIRGPMALTQQVRGKEPGETVSISVVRDDREQSFDVELGDRGSFEFDRHFFDGESFEVFGERMGEFGERMGELGERLGEMFDCDDGDCDFGFSHSFDCDEGDCRFDLGGLFDCDDGDCVEFHFDWSDRPMLGVLIATSTSELLEHLGSPDGSGVLVSKVISGSPADEAGLQVGDVIVSVDGQEIDGAGDIGRALRDKAGQSVDVEVIRDGNSRSLQVNIPGEEKENRPAKFQGGSRT